MVKIRASLTERQHGVPEKLQNPGDLPASARKLRRFYARLERRKKKDKENSAPGSADPTPSAGS